MSNSNCIYDITTDEYCIYLEQRGIHDFLGNVYHKQTNSILFLVYAYKRKPMITHMLLDTIAYGIISYRPYLAGQYCDGSIGAPVFYLFFQLCNAFSLDPVSCYCEVYNDITLTQEDVNAISTFAKWQGVEIITDWSIPNIIKVLDSLTEINNHQLRSVLEENLSQFIHE